MPGEPASSGHGPLEEPAIIPHPTRVGVWLIPDTEQGRAVIAQVPAARQPWPAERAHARILGSNALGILAGYTVFMAALAVMDQDLGLPLWLLWLLMALIAFRAVAGFGGAALFTIAFTILADMFDPAERAKFGGDDSGNFRRHAEEWYFQACCRLCYPSLRDYSPFRFDD